MYLMIIKGQFYLFFNKKLCSCCSLALLNEAILLSNLNLSCSGNWHEIIFQLSFNYLQMSIIAVL